MGRRQADRLDLDAGDQHRARELRHRVEHPASERAGDLPAHGRRLRQQGAERWRRRPDVRQARQGGERAGQADARSQRGASRHRQPAVGGGADQGRRLGGRDHYGVRCRILGYGRRRRGCGLSAAVHLSDRQPPPGAQGRLHQHRPAAPDAGARTPAGLVPHRDHDGRARRQSEHGSGRVPDQEPAARGAERHVAQLPARRGGGVRLGQAPPDRGQDRWTRQDRHGRGGLHLGWRRPRASADPL